MDAEIAQRWARPRYFGDPTVYWLDRTPGRSILKAGFGAKALPHTASWLSSAEIARAPCIRFPGIKLCPSSAGPSWQTCVR